MAIVVAVTEEWGIGRAGELPWHPKRLALDLAFLKHVTSTQYALEDGGSNRVSVTFAPPPGDARNAVIMGRRTWESLPPRFRPMEGRVNIVVTRNVTQFAEEHRGQLGVHAESSLAAAIARARTECSRGQIFILGGVAIYEEALHHPDLHAVFITRLRKHPPMPCDAIFPGPRLEERFVKTSNITAQIYQQLHSKLPKTAVVELSTDDDGDGPFVTEHSGSIKYEIDLFLPK